MKSNKSQYSQEHIDFVTHKAEQTMDVVYNRMHDFSGRVRKAVERDVRLVLEEGYSAKQLHAAWRKRREHWYASHEEVANPTMQPWKFIPIEDQLEFQTFVELVKQQATAYNSVDLKLQFVHSIVNDIAVRLCQKLKLTYSAGRVVDICKAAVDIKGFLFVSNRYEEALYSVAVTAREAYVTL